MYWVLCIQCKLEEATHTHQWVIDTLKSSYEMMRIIELHINIKLMLTQLTKLSDDF